jgi:hypothetical protein
MKSVSLKIRSTTSRVPFRAGSFVATLEEEGGDYLTLGTTRGHETWAAASSCRWAIRTTASPAATRTASRGT